MLTWIAARDSARPSGWKDCRTVRLARESLVAKKRGQVSLTQLKPMEAIFLEMVSSGCFPRPSASTVSRCDGQFTHANFTRWPDSPTIQRELVESGKAAVGFRRLRRLRESRSRGRKEGKGPMLVFRYVNERELTRFRGSGGGLYGQLLLHLWEIEASKASENAVYRMHEKSSNG